MLRSCLFALTLLVGVTASTGVGAICDSCEGGSNVDVLLGDSGWKLNGPSFYELEVHVTGEGVTAGEKWVSLTISKNFRFGPDPFTGNIPSITLDFSQVDGVADEDLATRIIIEEETINNSTGVDWTDFHWMLYRHGIAEFNTGMTNPTTDPFEYGWLTDPFGEYEWECNPAQDTEMLSVYNGLVPDGDSFHAGAGSGVMVIDLDLSADDRPSPAIFKLLQVPTIPEPAVVALMLTGVWPMLRRKR